MAKDPHGEGSGWVEIPPEGPLADLGWTVHLLFAAVEDGDQPVGLCLKPRQRKELASAVVSVERLRALPLRKVKDAAARQRREEYMATVTPDTRGPNGRWSDDHFELVATAYEIAVEEGWPPAPLIQGLWMVSRATASRWIRIARDSDPPKLAYPKKPGVAGIDRTTPPRGLRKRSRRP
jgi:hypothetical protein